jgi:hypothetical protein
LGVCGAATGPSCLDGMLERRVSRRQAHCGGVPRERCGDHERSLSHPVSRVTSGGGVASLRAIAEPSACTEARCLHASASTCTLPSTVDTRRDMARRPCIHKHGAGTFANLLSKKVTNYSVGSISFLAYLFCIDHTPPEGIEARMALAGEYYDVFFVTQLTRATALASIVAVDRVRVEPDRHSQTHRHNEAETVLFI